MIAARRLVAILALATAAMLRPASAQTESVTTLDALAARLRTCWRSPPASERQNGFEITVLFSLKRDGTILGRPRITFETAGATEAQRFAYRTAVMETLQRCTPMPVSGGLGEAIAGRPFRMRFDDRAISYPPAERRA